LGSIDGSYADIALHILTWLAFSARPLTIDEISEIVAIDVNSDPAYHQHGKLEDPQDVLTICSSLISISSHARDKSSSHSQVDSEDLVLLAHYSVKEYLISNRICNSSAFKYSLQSLAANKRLAEECLAYFLQTQQQECITEKSMADFKMTRYAAQYWLNHFRNAEVCDRTVNLAMDLFAIDSEAYVNWLRVHNIDRPWETLNLRRSVEGIPLPLYFASLGGLTKVVDLLTSRDGVDVNAEGGSCGNALQAAAFRGNNKIAELLIAKGADINAQGGCYGNALQAAAFRGNNKIAELLIAKGADVNVQGGEYGNALQAATSEGFDKIAELLIAKGADVNVQGGRYGNALQAATSEGFDKIAELLIAKGADVNAQGGDYGNALQVAALGGKDKIAELLILKGADVNAQGGEYGNALQAAALGGNDKMAKLMMAKGADVNAQG
jgi:ankyrin repeat protein